MRYLAMFALSCSLLACEGPATAPPLPTAHIAIATATAHPPTANIPATSVPATIEPSPTPAPTPTAAPATAHEQYRAWMEEARALHPYTEPTDAMWAVMICESTGNPGVIMGDHHGLFQYSSATWAGDWNPYRDQPILDPHAQIFATAKAWQDGYQHWWGCYGAAVV
jgi:hypothetical protein